MNTDSILKKILNKSKQDINPYPGLRPFQMDEHPYFFGREKQTRELIDILKKSRFISVIGTSGSGKSSLVRAGMLPFLYKGMMSDDAADWSICTFRPGIAPIDILVDKLFELSNKNENNNTLTKNKDFEKKWIKKTILDNNEGILHAYQQLNLSGKLLLVVDQFEEIFRYKNEADDQNEMARAFVHRLIKASRQNKEQIYVCITMRSDFLGDCSEFYDLPEVISKGMYLVPRLDRNELRKAITAPALLQNATVDPSLVDRLINDLDGRQDQLPLLQHALMRTFEIWKDRNDPKSYISMVDYKKSGTMDRALSDHGDSILKKIKTDHPDEIQSEEFLNIAKKLFQCITQKSGEKGIRRPASLKKISRTIGVPQVKVIKVINYFRDEKNSLLMPPIDKSKPQTIDLTPESIIDISHESLMRIWTRLKDWVEEEEEKGRKYKRVYDAYQLNEEQLAYKKSSYLVGRKLKVFHNYLKEIEPTNEWAERYGGKLEQVTNYIEKSYRRVHRQMATFFGSLALIAIFLFISYIASNQYLRSFIECYNTEIEASKTNDHTQSFIYSSKTLTTLGDANNTYGKLVFEFKNWIYELFSGDEDYGKISTTEMEIRAQKKLISAFNHGAFYSRNFEKIKQFAFSNDENYLFTIDNKNIIKRWNINNKNAEPIQYKIPNIGSNSLPTQMIVTKNNSTIYLSFKSQNSLDVEFRAIDISRIENRLTMKERSQYKIETKSRYSESFYLSDDEKLLFPDRITTDIREVASGKQLEEINKIQKDSMNLSFYNFSKDREISIFGIKSNYYINAKDEKLHRLLNKDTTKYTTYEYIELMANDKILITYSSDKTKIWDIKNLKLLEERKGNLNYMANDQYLVLEGKRKETVEIFDLKDLTQPMDNLKSELRIKGLNKKIGFPSVQAWKDGFVLVANHSNSPQSTLYQLPIKTKYDLGEVIDNSLFKFKTVQHFTPRIGQKNIGYINQEKGFIEFGKDLSDKKSITKYSPTKKVFGHLAEEGQLLIYQLKNYNSDANNISGHLSSNFFLAGFNKDSLIAYTHQGIYSFKDSYLQNVPNDYGFIIFSDDMSKLIGLQRDYKKLDIIPISKTTNEATTITSRYNIDQFVLNNDNKKVALTTFYKKSAKLRIYEGNEFDKSHTVNFYHKISELGFSKQSDDLAVVIKDTLLFIPPDFKGTKFERISDSLSFLKVMENKTVLDTISPLTFPTKINCINSFINEQKKEIWMVGLENGEIHTLNENKDSVIQIFHCGNYPINEIQHRRITLKDETEVDEFIISDEGTIYIFRQKTPTDNFELFIKLETTVPVRSILFNKELNSFFTVGENGFIKKWSINYEDIIEQIDNDLIYGDIYHPISKN